MMTPSPPFPEAALRALLVSRVAAWGAADGASAGGETRRVYVDAFAGAELQFGSGVAREAPEPTRAATVLEALDDACAETAPRALFVEEDPAHLQRIYAELEDVAGERLRATRDYASLAPGEASLVEAPFAAVAEEVARWIGNARAFVFLAPATARALPWTALRPLLALPDASLLVRFPHTDFEKQSRHVGPVADLPGFARRIVEGCSAFLGDERHAWLPAWRAAAPDGLSPALAGVLDRFAALLRSAAGARAVQPIEFAAADGARTWLFLVTADAAAAEVAEDAVIAETTADVRVAEMAAKPTVDAQSAEIDAPPVSAPQPSEGESSGDGTVETSPTEKPQRRRQSAMTAPSSAETESVETASTAAESGDAQRVEAGADATPIEAESAEPGSGESKKGEAKRGKAKPATAESSGPQAVAPEPAPSPEVLDLFPDQYVEEAAPKQRAPKARRREAAADDGLFSLSLDGEGATEDPTVPRDPDADG
jgi:hypothetical protein